MSTFIAWAPLIIILGTVLFGGWVYIQHLYQLENMRMHLNIDWTDGTSSRIEVEDYAQAQQLMNRLTFTWVKEANVTRGSILVGELNKLGTFTWLD